MENKEKNRDVVVATARIPLALHKQVSRAIAGTSTSFQSIFIDGLRSWLAKKPVHEQTPPPPPVAGEDDERAELAAAFLEWLDLPHGPFQQQMKDLVREMVARRHEDTVE